jgi:hypothetical protein
MAVKTKYTKEELEKALQRKAEFLKLPAHTSRKKLEDITLHW